MFRSLRLSLAGLLLLFPLSLSHAQTTKEAQTPKDETKPKPTVSKDQSLKGAKVAEPDPAAVERRNVAVSLLTSLADDARSFKDQKLRARVLARTADALWTTEPDRARDLFRRAWDAAEAGDAEAARLAAEDARRQQQETGHIVRRGAREMRSEVLRILAKRDQKLTEEFLVKLEEAAEREAKEAAADANRRRADQWAAPAAQAKRLALARTLLQDGDVERALLYAAPVLEFVNKDTIFFLSELRQKNAPAADAAFATLLARTARNAAADANTVSGLSSYAFTPLLYVTFDADGGSFANQAGPPSPAPDLSPNLRKAFFSTASGILMRPLPPPDQDTSTSGRTGKYMVLKRLMPLFEQYEPEQAAVLRTHMTALAAGLPEPDIAQGNRAIDRGIVPDDPEKDPLKTMQDRLDRAKTSEERDAIYVDVAVALAAQGDPKGRELAGKVEDSELRNKTIAYIDFDLLRDAAQKKDIPELLRIAKTGELTHIQRTWGYAEAARLVTATDRARAVDYLQEAATEARRIEAGDPDRARGLVAVASGFARTDRARVWDVISEAVKAANGSPGFTGDDGVLFARLQTKNMVVARNASMEDFNVAGVFSALASEDMYRSIELAKTFSAETARANATIATARAVLEPKKQPDARPN
ncbi:MAG TPA: hypothetical protein VN643_06960 [Pyrinomonadaceae bacterium]|nr:hypothetical protein [Pyrinomonadaceae bacterium]